jgi:hypothetical protein
VGSADATVVVGVGPGQGTIVFVTVRVTGGNVVAIPGSVTVVMIMLVTPGRVVVVTIPAAVTVVTTPGRVVVIVSTEVTPGRVVV